MHTVFHTALPFEAARHIPTLTSGHPGARLHGHSFLATLRSTLHASYAPYPGGELEILQAQWRAEIDRLNYRLLNDQITSPTDLHIARWLLSRCRVPGVSKVALQSTPQRGVELDAKGCAQVWRRYAFQAAHQLPMVGPGHKCGTMHGHGFEVVLHICLTDNEDPSDNGYAELDLAWASVHAELDYACLNELPGLENPTSEIISSWLWNRMQASLPTLRKVTVFETASCGAMFDGVQYRIWKDMTLDSALRFQAAPPGNPRRRLHGHTYSLRLNLTAPLNHVMGWTVDFGDVKDLFNPVFQALDHRPLHQIADLADCDTATVAAWILNRARANLPQIDGIELFESPGLGVIAGV